MNKVKIAVVEDELIIADNICSSLESLGYQVFEPAITFTEGKNLVDKERPDIVILDINLSGRKDGIDLAHYIKENYDIPFIFLTAHADKATIERAKKVNPPAYLVKPFREEELYTSIEVAIFNHEQNKANQPQGSRKQFIYIKQKNQFLKLRFEDILFLKVEHVYLDIYTVQGEKHMLRESLNDFETKLNEDFIRIHRSCIVNVNHIDLIESQAIKIASYELPLARKYRTSLMEKIER